MAVTGNDIAELTYEIRELRHVLVKEIPDPDEYTDLLNRALEKWGFGTQVLIWIEELSELIQRIAKRDRKINPSFDDQIADEIADVDICLDQMKILFPEYQAIKIQKVERLRRLVQHG